MSYSQMQTLQRVSDAKEAFFHSGLLPSGLVDDAILNSWQRCSNANKRTNESVDFAPVSKPIVRELIDRNRTLIEAASTPVESLMRAVAGAGYAVLLTDAKGFALTVGGAIANRDRALQMAFRQGVDLSEHVVGTTAMSCAMAERKAVRVFGPEHFYARNQLFNCIAAPIISPVGAVLGSIDISRDDLHVDPGALTLVDQCAKSVHRALFKSLEAFLTIELHWTPESVHFGSDLLVALGPNGEVLGCSESVRSFFLQRQLPERMMYDDLFDGRFEDLVDQIRQCKFPVPVRLRTGLGLLITPAFIKPNVHSRKTGRIFKPTALRNDRQIVEFGDETINSGLEKAGRALANELPVLLLGETGTGKEVLAHALHNCSRHADGPLIAINCASIPESLIEGELFGHIEGAFTGARKGGNPGKIELAHGGTLFLDEIGDMPLPLQARLLRVLETREVCRLGASDGRYVDFQLVCATHQNLENSIAQGRFRQDLFFRINGFTMTIPPLRSRSGLKHFLNTQLNEISGYTRDFSADTLQLLLNYPWPGNVRELRQALTYAHAIGDEGEEVSLELLPDHIRDFFNLKSSDTSSGEGVFKSMQSEAIKKALEQTGGHVGNAAKLLGLSRATLYRKLSSVGK